MKSLLPLLFLTVAFSSCTTMANRRDIYRPTKPDGPYTKAMHGEDLPGQAEDDAEDS